MHLLFVCTGNTCRSPLAEVIARQLIAERGLSDVTVGSAGTSAWPGSPASDGSLLVALEHDLDLSEHRARLLSSELVAESDVILTMGAHHRDRAAALGGAGRTWMLTGFVDNLSDARPIGDPVGGDLSVYRETYKELRDEIERALTRLVADRA